MTGEEGSATYEEERLDETNHLGLGPDDITLIGRIEIDVPEVDKICQSL